MVNRFQILRYFAYAIEIIAVFTVCQTPGLLPELFGARPVILIPIALSIAMFESETAGMAFGLLCGLLVDFGISNTLGFHGVLLAITCYAIGLMVTNLLKTNLLTALLVASIVLFAIFLLQWIFYYALYGYGNKGYALINHYFPRFVYSLAFVPLTFYFNRAFALLIKPRED